MSKMDEQLKSEVICIKQCFHVYMYSYNGMTCIFFYTKLCETVFLVKQLFICENVAIIKILPKFLLKVFMFVL